MRESKNIQIKVVDTIEFTFRIHVDSYSELDNMIEKANTNKDVRVELHKLVQAGQDQKATFHVYTACAIPFAELVKILSYLKGDIYKVKEVVE